MYDKIHYKKKKSHVPAAKPHLAQPSSLINFFKGLY